MKVLLVNPNSAADVASPPQFKLSYAVLYLASVLEENGDELRIVDRNTDPVGIKGVLSNFWPDMVGVSVMTGPCILDALLVSRLTKQINSDVQVVWGGVYPTLLHEMCLSEPSVDYVVRRVPFYKLLPRIPPFVRDMIQYTLLRRFNIQENWLYKYYQLE